MLLCPVVGFVCQELVCPGSQVSHTCLPTCHDKKPSQGTFSLPIKCNHADSLEASDFQTHVFFRTMSLASLLLGISILLLPPSCPVPSPSCPVTNLFREASEKGERNAIHSAAPAPSDTLCLPIQFIKDFLLVRSNQGAGMPPADRGLCCLQNANSMGIR